MRRAAMSGPALAAVSVVRAGHHQAGQLAVRAGRGLQGHPGHPGDGEQRLLELQVELDGGERRGFMGVVRDVTERRAMEEALRRERDFAESLVETAQAIVLVLDRDGRILRFNRCFK